jgi:hypothetical protein
MLTAMPPEDDDPNGVAAYNSPACLLHEVDPAYLGYMTDAEVLALLEAVYARTQASPADAAVFNDMLAHHIRRLGGGPSAITAAGRDPADRIADLLQQAVPRIADPTLHADLNAVLAAWTHRS